MSWQWRWARQRPLLPGGAGGAAHSRCGPETEAAPAGCGASGPGGSLSPRSLRVRRAGARAAAASGAYWVLNACFSPVLFPRPHGTLLVLAKSRFPREALSFLACRGPHPRVRLAAASPCRHLCAGTASVPGIVPVSSTECVSGFTFGKRAWRAVGLGLGSFLRT